MHLPGLRFFFFRTPNRSRLVYSPCSWQQRQPDISEAGTREETANQQAAWSACRINRAERSSACQCRGNKSEAQSKKKRSHTDDWTENTPISHWTPL